MPIGFAYCGISATHEGVGLVAFSNSHGPGFRGESLTNEDGWGDQQADLRLGYEEGKKLAARVDLDGDVPDYIVSIFRDGTTTTTRRFGTAPFKVRDLK